MSEIKQEVDWSYDLVVEKLASDANGDLYIAGYASNESEDEDGEIMDQATLKKLFDTYMKNPVVKFMHDKAPQWKGAIGKVVPEYTDVDGNVHKTFFSEKPYLVIKLARGLPSWMYESVKDGTYSGLSIGGKLAKRVGNRLFVKSWLETSLVDIPSAKGSFVDVLKAAGAQIEDEPIEELEEGINKFSEINHSIRIGAQLKELDLVMKGGVGSGIKGHTTPKQKYDKKIKELDAAYKKKQKELEQMAQEGDQKLKEAADAQKQGEAIDAGKSQIKATQANNLFSKAERLRTEGKRLKQKAKDSSTLAADRYIAAKKRAQEIYQQTQQDSDRRAKNREDDKKARADIRAKQRETRAELKRKAKIKQSKLAQDAQMNERNRKLREKQEAKDQKAKEAGYSSAEEEKKAKRRERAKARREKKKAEAKAAKEGNKPKSDPVAGKETNTVGGVPKALHDELMARNHLGYKSWMKGKANVEKNIEEYKGYIKKGEGLLKSGEIEKGKYWIKVGETKIANAQQALSDMTDTFNQDYPSTRLPNPYKYGDNTSPEQIKAIEDHATKTKQTLNKVLAPFLGREGGIAPEVKVKRDGTLTYNAYLSTGDRGPRQDHGGPDGDDWMDDHEVESVSKPYMEKWKPTAEKLQAQLHSMGLTGAKVSVDYGEKGHVALQVWGEAASPQGKANKPKQSTNNTDKPKRGKKTEEEKKAARRERARKRREAKKEAAKKES